MYGKRSLTRAIMMALVNFFCLAHPLKNDSPSLRHYTLGLYPLHYIVNITTLLFLHFFSTNDFIIFNGIIFYTNYITIVAFTAAFLNLVFLLFFLYPNILCVARTSIKGKISGETYRLKIAQQKSRKKTKVERGFSFKPENFASAV